MASDIRISELNEITVNRDINEFIINSRETSNDTGISKKIQMANLLTENIVKTNNINPSAVTNTKLAGEAVTPDKIADKSITNAQIKARTIGNDLLADNAVNPRVLSEEGSYAADEFIALGSLRSRNSAQVDNNLSVPTGKVNLRNIQYCFPATESPRRFLRTDGSGNLSWAEAVPGDGTALVFSDTSPVGTIIPYAGGQSSVPDDKWINLYSERRFLGSAYPELRDLLGTKWGPRQNANGSANPSGAYYALPDIRGRAVLGAGQGDDGDSVCTTNFATYGGKYRHLLTRQEIKPMHFTGTFSKPGNDDWYPFLINKPGTTTFNPGARAITNTCYCGRWVAGESQRTNPNPVPGGTGTPPNPNKPYNSMTATQLLNDDQSMDNIAHDNVQPYVAMSYIIKAKPDDIQQYDVSVGPGLSALDAQGLQTGNVDLSSSEIGVKVTDDFQFDGSGRLTLNDNVSASSITFDDGSVQNTASLIIAGSVAADGTVNTGTGFTSVRNSEGRYTITLPDAGAGKIWMLTANAHSVNQNGSEWFTRSFEPHVVELVYVNNNNIQLNVKIGNYNGGWVAQYEDAIVNFIAVKSDV